MTSFEALELLRKFQSQIIHGSNVFGDIAEVITHLENVGSELQGSWEKCHESWASNQGTIAKLRETCALALDAFSDSRCTCHEEEEGDTCSYCLARGEALERLSTSV